MGRGGRIILDRLSNDDFWRTLDYTIYETKEKRSIVANKNIVKDSTNSLTNLEVGNSLNHKNSNNYIKTEISHNNIISRTSVSEVSSESVSDNQCIKQEPMEIEEEKVNHLISTEEDMLDYSAYVQDWYAIFFSQKLLIYKLTFENILITLVLYIPINPNLYKTSV